MVDGQNGPTGLNAMKAGVEITQLAGKGIAMHHHHRTVEEHAWEIVFNVDLATQLKVSIADIANTLKQSSEGQKQQPGGVRENLAKIHRKTSVSKPLFSLRSFLFQKL